MKLIEKQIIHNLDDADCFLIVDEADFIFEGNQIVFKGTLFQIDTEIEKPQVYNKGRRELIVNYEIDIMHDPDND